MYNKGNRNVKKLFENLYKKYFRNKTYSIINILGLSIGIAFSIFHFFMGSRWIEFMMVSIKNADEIIVLLVMMQYWGKWQQPGPLAGYMKDNFPDVGKATIYMPYAEGSSFKYNERVFQVKNGAFVIRISLKCFRLIFSAGVLNSSI